MIQEKHILFFHLPGLSMEQTNAIIPTLETALQNEEIKSEMKDAFERGIDSYMGATYTLLTETEFENEFPYFTLEEAMSGNINQEFTDRPRVKFILSKEELAWIKSNI